MLEPPQYAKAVGVQPRTLEIFEGMGVLRQVLDEAVEFGGQIVYVDGQEVNRLDWPSLPDIPFGFIGIPQYETERILRERLAGLGTQIERDVRLVGFEQDDEGVTATLEGPDGEETVRAAYLVGADGAHSVVRKTLGLSFEGGAFTEQYMLGDVEVDWSIPPGLAVRSTHTLEDGTVDGARRHPAEGRRALPHVDARPDAPVDGGRRRRRDRPRLRLRRHAHPGGHPDRHRPARPRTRDRPQPAVVLGVPDQPPHRRPVLGRARRSSPATPPTSTRRPARRA